MIKTAVEKFDELQNRILQISKDEVPEIIAVPVTEIHNEYKNWLLGSLD